MKNNEVVPEGYTLHYLKKPYSVAPWIGTDGETNTMLPAIRSLLILIVMISFSSNIKEYHRS